MPDPILETKPTREERAGEIRHGLCFFTGSQKYYRHWLGIKYTEGVQYLAEKAGAYWLIDAIGSHWATKKSLRAEEFLIVRLTVNVNATDYMAGLRFYPVWDADDPKKYKSICTQRIEYTDCPLDLIELYLCDGVLMLKSEY